MQLQYSKKILKNEIFHRFEKHYLFEYLVEEMKNSKVIMIFIFGYFNIIVKHENNMVLKEEEDDQRGVNGTN